MNERTVVTPGLRANRVSGLEMLGHGIANITPSAMAAVTVALVAADGGAFTWLVYAAVGVVMWLVARQVARLAEAMPAAGSMFVYLGRGLHPLAGLIAGWSMVGGYLGALFAAPVLVGIFVAKALALAHVAIPAWPIAILAAALGWGLAVRDVEIATRFALIVEIISLLAMMAVGVITLAHHGWWDAAQFAPAHFNADGFVRAATLTVLAYGGFETAGNLAREGRVSRHSASGVMVLSVWIVGLFFVFMAYAVVAGFGGDTARLGHTMAPLNALAVQDHTPVFGWLADAGMATAAFSATIATFNSISRILYSMSRHQVLPAWLGRVHERTGTPVAALNLLGVLTVGFSVLMHALHLHVLQVIDLFGIFTSLGFIVIYLLSLVATPVYLRRQGLRVPVGSWLALLVGVPVLLRVLLANMYPVPAFPKGLVTWLFFGYLLSAVGLFLWWRRRDPGRMAALAQGLAGD